VARNRAKRRLREAARLMLDPDGLALAGYDLVLIARDGTGSRPWDKLLGDLRGALRQVGVTEPATAEASP
jgi:ribonuclease P protein component